MSRDQNEGRSHSIKTDNSTFEWVEKLKYFGTTLTNRNYVQEEIKSRLKWGNACYHSVQNLLSSSLLSRHSKTKIYRTIILPVVLYGCETWSLTLREERRMRVFENRVLRTIFGPKRDGVTGEWRKLHNEERNDLYSSPSIVRVIKSRRMRWAVHVALMGRGELYTVFWLGNLRERDHLGDPDTDERIILKWILRQWDLGVWTGSSWLGIVTGCGHLWMRWWAFGFHKMRGISWLAENRLASQEGLCSME